VLATNTLLYVLNIEIHASYVTSHLRSDVLQTSSLSVLGLTNVSARPHVLHLPHANTYFMRKIATLGLYMYTWYRNTSIQSWDSFTLSIFIKYRKANVFSRNMLLFIIRYLSDIHIIFILHIITNLLFDFCFAIFCYSCYWMKLPAKIAIIIIIKNTLKNDYTNARYTMSNFLCANIFFQTFDRISCSKLLVHHILMSNMM